eukprot:804772-Pleurochrysis_carterae.AAC.1
MSAGAYNRACSHTSTSRHAWVLADMGAWERGRASAHTDAHFGVLDEEAAERPGACGLAWQARPDFTATEPAATVGPVAASAQWRLVHFVRDARRLVVSGFLYHSQ